MTRRLIYILAIIITLSLVGFIVLQSFWLKNAWKIKEDQFSQQVNQALLEINKKVETQETVVEVTNEVFSVNYDLQNLPAFYRFYNTMNPGTDSVNKGYSLSKESVFYQKDNTTNTNTRIVISSGDSILYKKLYTKSSNDIPQILSQDDIGKEISSKLSNKTLLVEKIVNKLLNYCDDISKRIDKATLQAIISSELKNSGILINYEFAVKDENSNIIYSSDYFDKKNIYDAYKVQLFPHDLFSVPYYLVLYFPEKEGFIIRSVGTMGLASIIVTIIIIISYFLTFIIIFRQKKLSEMKNDFINNMTHELKTPISTISLASQMLTDKSISEGQKNLDNIAKIIGDESRRLGYQVEKVLQMAIFERGDFKMKIKSIDIHTLIKNTVEGFKIQIDQKNGKIDIKLCATKTIIDGDEMHLANVLLNLLENAVKYCNTSPEILVTTKSTRKNIVLSVQDNGIGISRDDQKRIFEKFYRVHTGNIHNVKGFGLGLSYVKRIIEIHAGTISVNSEPGHGSVFTIELPYKHDNDERLQS